MVQDDICRRMLMHAQAGKRIVRLKGGDPAIFARTVEETDILTQHDIPFYIVPGITSASGASAYSGIPLTHRECAQSVRFITASLRNPESEPNWDEVVSSSENQTLVFYMGLKKLATICDRLQQHNMDSSMPVAVIDSACTPRQRIAKGRLDKIAEEVANQNFEGPAMIIIGKVVNYEQFVSTKLLAQSQLAQYQLITE